MSNSVNFKANDVGVSSFMEKMKRQSQEMTSQVLRDSERQKQSAKELLEIVEQRIKAQQKLSQLDLSSNTQGVRNWVQDRQAKAGTQLESLRTGWRDQYRSGSIDVDEYKRRIRKLDRLANNYSDESIEGKGQEKIKELKEQAKNSNLLNRYMLDNISAVRGASREQVAAIQRGDAKVSDTIEREGFSSNQNELASRLARETIQEESRGGGRGTGSQMWSLASALAIERVGGMLAQMPGAKTEMDFVKPIMSMMGMGAGGLTGIGLDALAGTKIMGTGAGDTSFGALGMTIGSKAGEFAGAALERHIRGNDALQGMLYGSESTSGKEYSRLDVASLGLDYNQAEGLRRGFMQSKGKSVDNTELRNIIGLDKGYGVSSGTTQAMYELVRSNKQGDKNAPAIIAGIKEAVFGQGDRSFLNEFLTKNYAQLQKTMISTQEHISSGAIVSILKGFSGLGGQFGMQDPRSVGLITQIQSSLSNPGSDAGKALAFHVMRQQNPEMNMLDTQIEIQKGMGSKKYLQSMMGYILGQGGDESYQVNNVASFFGLQGNLSAAKRLVSGYKDGNLPESFGQYNISGDLSNAVSTGESLTQKYGAKSAAEIENAYINSAVEGLGVMSKKTLEMFGTVITELEKEVKIAIGKAFKGEKTETKAPTDNDLKKNGLMRTPDGRIVPNNFGPK